MAKEKRLIDLIIESIAANMEKDLEKLSDIMLESLGPKNYCIGSGGSFRVYEDISYKEAKKIFNNLDVRINCGTLIEKKSIGVCRFETYHTMESSSGKTTLFMFDIDRVVHKKA